MKTKQELIDEFRGETAIEFNLQKNAEAAGDHGMSLYHRGRKQAFQRIADNLTRWDIKPDETTETTLVG